MIKHLLVPLDGTFLAEAALPVTKTMAKLFGARVTLLHVVEKTPAPIVHGERHLTELADAERYLDLLAQQFAAQAIPCNCHVHSVAVEQVAGGIVAHEEEYSPDLIVMCTHGPGTLGRLLRGSLAQQVVALGQTPLLLVRPGTRAAHDPFILQRMLVPLDGDPEHEHGFELACTMAAASQAQLRLLSVLPKVSSLAGRQADLSRYLPGTTLALQEATLQNLKDYLERMLARVAERGIEGVGEISYGRTAKAISSAAESVDADLIVLATHGKAGTRAFWANSVAAQVQGQSSRALMLVPL
jgi:nucleotide-binding universal stress UspA family protein